MRKKVPYHPVMPPSILILSILAAATLASFYIVLIYWVDRYEKEPLWLLLTTFLWGAIPSAAVSYVFNSLLSIPIYVLAGEEIGANLAASFIAPPVEETIKGLMLVGIFFFWRREIDSILDGIIYGAMVGMGFAMVENVYYFVNVYNAGGVEAWGVNIFFRGIVFGLNHALFTSMTGLGIAIARLTSNRSLKLIAPIGGWFASMFLHFVHNTAVSFENALCLVSLVSGWGGVLITLAIIFWSLVQERNWLREFLQEEVTLGIISQAQYQTAVSGRRRVQQNLSLLSQRGFGSYRQASRFYHTLSKLAYKKHHQTQFHDPQSAEDIAELREQIRQLSPIIL